MTELKSKKVLHYTYAFIVLITMGSLITIYKTKETNRIIFFLFFIATLILSLYYIKAVKNNDISYLNTYRILTIVYTIIMVIATAGVTYSLFGFLMYISLLDRNKSSEEENTPMGTYVLVIVIVFLFVAFCGFLFYYQRLVSKYYNQVKMGYDPSTENRNNKTKVSESKILTFTYIFIVLAIIVMVFAFITKVGFLLLIIFPLIMAFFYIKAVKNKNASYLKAYYIVFILTIIMAVLLTVISTYVVYNMFIDNDLKDTSSKIEMATFILALILFCLFIIYYTILISKFYNQVEMENVAIEENRLLESNGSSNTNGINNCYQVEMEIKTTEEKKFIN